MKKFIAFTAALTLAISLVACAANSQTNAPSVQDASGSNSTPIPASSTASTTEETSKVDSIKAAGKLIMCTNLAFPPFEYVGEDGKAAGVDIEIAEEIAKDLGVELEVLDMNFDLLIDSVKSGKADFAAAGMTVKPERLEQVDFSTEYVKSAQYVIVKKGSGVTAQTLDGLTIAVQEATTGDLYATDNIQAKEVMRFKSGIEAGAALAAGKCDAVIIDELPAKSIAANNAKVLEVLAQSLTEESYAIAVSKQNPDLTAAINQTLERLMSEGKIDELVTKHMTGM